MLKNTLKYDLPAGLVVFLVALPLCLGIALASEAPLISGLIAGVVGGVVVGMLSGARLSVSGPAAGLTVLVASSIQSLGSFENFLAAAVLAGALQVVFGLLGAGVLGALFPVSVIKGMLSAIGLIIILKQIPHALGRDEDFIGDLGFWSMGGADNTFTDIVRAIMTFSPGAVLLFAASIGIILLWERPFIKDRAWSRFIPGPLVAVLAGSFLNVFFGKQIPHLSLSSEHLVQLPASFGELLSQMSRPNWSAFTQPAVWGAAVTLSLIASIETLLAIEATDKLDPGHDITPTNRELLAQGAGNMVSAALGGLPVTSVIVRSSANLYAGARSKVSTIAHGLMLALAVALIPGLLNQIPLATLAAVLILVGYKLCKPYIFISQKKMGWEQFGPFLATVVAIVFTDLLKGVLIGSLVGVFVILKSNFQSAITVATKGDDHLILFTKDVTFIHKIRLQQELSKIPDGASLLVDGTRAHFIDHDIYEMLSDFRGHAQRKKIQFELRNVKDKQFTLSKAATHSAPTGSSV